MQKSELAHQYQRLTSTWGYYPLENWSVITLQGDDRASFLHNMCTQEILKRHPGSGCEFFLTDVKGHVIAHAYLQVGENSLRLLTAPGQASMIMDHLDRYIIREDVVLVDESNCWTSLIVLGSKSAFQLANLAESQHPTLLSALRQPWQHTQLILTGHPSNLAPWEVAQTDWLHIPCYLLQIPIHLPGSSQSEPDTSRSPERATAEICHTLNSTGAYLCDKTAWSALRIESGLPLWGIDFNQDNLPQEVARDEQAISFHKGCYLGQETIARIDALGHVNQQITTIQFAGKEVPDPGTSLLAKGKKIGTVTSSCWSPHWNRPLALAMVRRGFNAPGTQLESAVGTASVLGEVIDRLPL
jgi:folate-binding protein YgfZ